MKKHLYNLIFSITTCLLIISQTAIYANDPDNLLLDQYRSLLERKSPREKMSCVLSNIPQEELFHLFIDKERMKPEKMSADEQEYISINGQHKLFDLKEPGYYQAMEKSFQLLLELMDRPVSMSLVEKIHDQAVKDVFDEEKQPHLIGFYYPRNKFLYNGYHIRSQISPTLAEELISDRIIDNSSLNSETIDYSKNNGSQFFNKEKEEIDKSITLFFDSTKQDISYDLSHIPLVGIIVPREQADKYPHRVVSNIRALAASNYLFKTCIDGTMQSVVDQLQNVIALRPVFLKETIETRMKPEIERYHHDIKNAHNDDEKFEAMATLIRKLEMAHFFKDGNQRTYTFLLLNRLLVENNYPPAILDNNFIFDGFADRKEMGQAIKKGINNYLEKFHGNGQRPKCPENLTI